MINCKFENGNKASLRHVCVNAIVVKNNKVLLGKRGTYKGKKLLESGKWALIGGFFDRDEYLEEGLRREIMEESGWTVGEPLLLRINDNPNRPAEDRQNVDIVFVVEAVSKEGKSDEEVSRLKWFDLDELPEEKKIAFDHGEHLKLYKKHLKKAVSFPVWGRIEI